MSEKHFTQQEIAPCETEQANADLSSCRRNHNTAPAEKRNKGGGFFRLSGTLRIVYTAVFIAIGVGLKFLKVDFGGNAVSFFYIPCFLAGAFFGPLFGFSVGALGDLIGVFLTGKFSPIGLVLTLGNGLNGLIFGLVFRLPLKAVPKIIIGAVTCLFAVTLGINALGLSWIIPNSTYFQIVFLPSTSLLPRIVFQPVVLALNTAIVIPLYFALRRTLFKRFAQPKAVTA